MADEIRPNEDRPYSYGRSERIVSSETRPAFLKRISWGAVFAGVLIALVVQLLLSLLGLGIGFGSIDARTEANPFSGLGTGALVWWVISMLIALFAGGITAGRLAGVPRSFDGVLHGVLSFSVFTLFSFYLLTTAVGGIISGVGGLVGETIAMAGRGVSAAAPEIAGTVKQELQDRGIDLAFLKREAREILQQTGKPELQPDNLERQARGAGRDISDEVGSGAQNPQNAGNSADNIIEQLFSRADKVVDAADRDAAVNVVMERTGKTRAESEEIVDNWIASYNQAKVKFDTLKSQAGEQARKTGDAVASAASKASIYAFIGLLLGLAAAAVGGNIGRPKTITVDEEYTRRV